MGIFLKDPKTCMNPWYGLMIIVCVCSCVVGALILGEHRYKSSKKQVMSQEQVVTSTGLAY